MQFLSLRSPLAGVHLCWRSILIDYIDLLSQYLIKLPWSKKQITNWVLKTLEANKGIEGEKVIRIIVSGGPSWTLSPAKTPTDEFEIGRNNHFDIYVFRNVGMYGDGEPFTKISASVLDQDDVGGLINESAKYRVISEFLEYILGRINLKDVKSNIDSHDISVKLMSGVCHSGANMNLNKNPLIRISI